MGECGVSECREVRPRNRARRREHSRLRDLRQCSRWHLMCWDHGGQPEVAVHCEAGESESGNKQVNDRRAMREGGRAWLMFKSLAVAAAAACLVVLVSTGPWARAPSILGEVASTAQALNSGELK